MQNEDPSTHDAQTLDSATADQAKEQEKAHFPEMHSDGDDDGEDEGEEEMKSALLEENDELSVSEAILQSNMSVMKGTKEGGLKYRKYQLPVGFWSLRMGHVRYINILTWLRVKLLYLVLFSLYPGLFRELRDKRNLKNLQF